MNIVLKNLQKFETNYYKGIEINEFTERDECLVKFFGRDVWFDSSFVGVSRISKLESLSFEDKIRFIVKDYLDNTRIDYFTGIIKSRSIYGNMWFEANGTRYLSFNIKNNDLRTLLDDVWNKYCNDRYDFCYMDHGIKRFMINTADFSSYEIVEDKLSYDNVEIIKLVLKTDNKGIIDSECKFVLEFIIDIFSKYNEEIRIERVYDSKYLRKGILLRCMDIEFYIPYYQNLLWIIDEINKYNKELRDNKNRNKIRQLKMEGF